MFSNLIIILALTIGQCTDNFYDTKTVEFPEKHQVDIMRIDIASIDINLPDEQETKRQIYPYSVSDRLDIVLSNQPALKYRARIFGVRKLQLYI